jgi:hypothetical protein
MKELDYRKLADVLSRSPKGFDEMMQLSSQVVSEWINMDLPDSYEEILEFVSISSQADDLLMRDGDETEREQFFRDFIVVYDQERLLVLSKISSGAIGTNAR